MIDLMVDTCVFFKMIEFNNFVIENGEEKLGEYINHKIQRLKLRETELTEKFGEEFANLYKDYSFDEKLDLIKDFLNRKESRLLREIEKNEHLAKGEVFDYKDVNYDADGKKIEINHYKFNPHITEEKKARQEAEKASGEPPKETEGQENSTDEENSSQEVENQEKTTDEEETEM